MEVDDSMKTEDQKVKLSEANVHVIKSLFECVIFGVEKVQVSKVSSTLTW